MRSPVKFSANYCYWYWFYDSIRARDADSHHPSSIESHCEYVALFSYIYRLALPRCSFAHHSSSITSPVQSIPCHQTSDQFYSSSSSNILRLVVRHGSLPIIINSQSSVSWPFVPGLGSVQFSQLATTSALSKARFLSSYLSGGLRIHSQAHLTTPHLPANPIHVVWPTLIMSITIINADKETRIN